MVWLSSRSGDQLAVIANLLSGCRRCPLRPTWPARPWLPRGWWSVAVASSADRAASLLLEELAELLGRVAGVSLGGAAMTLRREPKPAYSGRQDQRTHWPIEASGLQSAGSAATGAAHQLSTW